MRFHQGLTFLPVHEVVDLAVASDDLGYAGLMISDHIFNARELKSRYTYSTADDGSPFWEKDTEWPDPMCLISGLATVTRNLLFTTGVYIAPARDLVTVAKSVGTTAVLSSGRLRLGVGVGWCEEEFTATGQDFSNRGKRLDEMIVALRGSGTTVGSSTTASTTTYRRAGSCRLPPSRFPSMAVADRLPHCAGPRPSATAGSCTDLRLKTRRGNTSHSSAARSTRRAATPMDSTSISR